MKIEVFGPGCAKCTQSYEVAVAFLARHGLPGEVVKHTDLATMTERGVLRTPTTMIDGEIVVAGRLLREADLDRWLAEHGAAR
ncbi:MAG: thioredoxin family protein [Planctomycetes bacterium]|nr:thioredoxin family protein [Planctomycetota bacterium]